MFSTTQLFQNLVKLNIVDVEFCNYYRIWIWPMTLFVWWVLRLSKMLTKMTDTFDIQINNTFRTKFAHQCKFISALHAIIPINNSMQHYLFSSLELRCWVFFFFGNSHNGWYKSQRLQELRMLTLIALWDITLNVTFQDVWEYRSAMVLFSQYREDISIESIWSVDNIFRCASISWFQVVSQSVSDLFHS